MEMSLDHEEIEVRAPMEKMRSGLETEPSSSSIVEEENRGIQKIPLHGARGNWTRRELLLAGITVVALIALVVGLVVALAPRKKAPTLPTDNTQNSPFPTDKEFIDNACLNNQNMTACWQACEPAKCCAAAGRNGCFSEYPDSCLAYTSCHAIWADNTTTTTAAAPLNLHKICSRENKSACRKACQAAESCWNEDSNSSCVSDNLFKCLDYAPCQVLKQTSTNNNALYPADTSLLLESCFTDDTRQQCQDQCREASCCWTDNQDDDCFQTDFISCLTYAPCPEFKQVLPPPHSRVDPPRVDLQELCRVDSILTIEGFQACQVKCEQASCCKAAREPYNCFHEDPLGCLAYAVCSLLQQASGSVPRAPVSMQETCREYQNLGIDDLQWCIESCQRGACCLAEKTDNCVEHGNQLACEEYAACQPLLQATQTSTALPRPPAQLQVCTPENLQTVAGWNMCAKLCQPATCCNSLGDDNCLLDNISACSEWNAGGCYLFANIGRSENAGFIKQSDYLGKR